MSTPNSPIEYPSNSPWVKLFDEHTMASVNFRWASALFEGIELAMENQRHQAAQGMAELGRYFADTWIAHHENEARDAEHEPDKDAGKTAE